MTLKEKLEVIKNYDDQDPHETFMAIADDYAIGFLEWYFSDDGNNLIHDLILVGELDKNTNTQELLELFKKEKGL